MDRLACSLSLTSESSQATCDFKEEIILPFLRKSDFYPHNTTGNLNIGTYCYILASSSGPTPTDINDHDVTRARANVLNRFRCLTLDEQIMHDISFPQIVPEVILAMEGRFS